MPSAQNSVVISERLRRGNRARWGSRPPRATGYEDAERLLITQEETAWLMLQAAQKRLSELKSGMHPMREAEATGSNRENRRRYVRDLSGLRGEIESDDEGHDTNDQANHKHRVRDTEEAVLLSENEPNPVDVQNHSVIHIIGVDYQLIHASHEIISRHIGEISEEENVG